MVRSAAAATGAGNTLGNKGGVAIYMKIGLTSILLVNAHLAAHQDKESQRNLDFDKISKTIPIMLERKELREGSKRNLMNLMGTSARSLAKFGSGNDLRSEEFGMKTATSFGGNGRGSKEVDHVTSVDADLTEEDTILKPVREDSMAGMSLADSKDDRNRLSIDLSQTTTGVNHNESTRRSTPAKSSKTINGGVVENSEEATTELDEKLSYDSDEARDQVPAIIEINSNNDLQERAPLVDANARSFSMGNIDCVSSEAMEGITEMRGIDTQRGIALNSPDRAIKSSHSMDAMNSFKVKSLDDCADIVVFMGDLNYRIKGNR